MLTETKPLPDRKAFFSQEERLFSSFMDLYRRSAIGMLVKGIAHNLNGSLQILSMQIELLQVTAKKGEGTLRGSLCASLDECMKSLDKMTAMVEDLLKKGTRHDDDVPGAVSLNALLEEELVFLDHNLFFKHQVKVNKILSPRPPVLNGYYVDFREGLSGLIVNAVEAMEEAPLRELKVATERGDREVKVVIGDTGCGISDEVKPHLFKPFFTTKKGKHHGLGLFMVRELLSPYGASFQIASRKGETTFTVTFPFRPEAEGHLSGPPNRKVSLL